MKIPHNRIPLARLFTPLEYAPTLTKVLGGPRILLKRDDLTGLAQGGNKSRKLEYILADAMERGCDTVVTAGMPQSNHCLQTAAGAAKCGFECHLVLGLKEPIPHEGNQLLDALLGAELHWTEKTNREVRLIEVAEELKSRGKNPYVIPIGGSNLVGSLGYVHATLELRDQLESMEENVDHIVFGTSSGGTQAGLVVGSKLTGLTTHVLGISIDQVPDDHSEVKYHKFVTELAQEVGNFVSLEDEITSKDVLINYDFLGEGYGVVSDLERRAIQTMARCEGVLLGPVYSGRAFGGLMQLIKEGYFRSDETVLFWHTGGASVLPMYAKELSLQLL